jgi:plasmid stabilization system protein ParE
MGLQIVAKKRFLNSFKKVTTYLKLEWNKTVAEDFNKIVQDKLDFIAAHPTTGAITAIKNTRSVIVGKGHQNKIYYRIENNKIIVINMIDTRKNPKNNPFNKQQ